jgi:UDP-N-acetylglucosamine transferase subunit ALG13
MPGTFVSIGNCTQSFRRLLDAVAAIADQLPQPVVVQHGRTPFQSDTIQHFPFTDEEGFLRHLKESELFITHSGGGSVFSAIKLGRKPVVVPRRKMFEEHVDDHQVAFAKELERQSKIVAVYDIDFLADAAESVLANPILPQIQENEDEAVEIIRRAALEYAPNQSDPICLVTPSGGHLTEIRALSKVYKNNPHLFVINVEIVQPKDMQGKTIVITISERDWKFIINMYEAFNIILNQKPKLIITTGGAFSVAFALVGKLFNIPTIYIETVGKVNVPTLTGRFMYYIADKFYYQWKYLEKFFPKGKYLGIIL